MCEQRQGIGGFILPVKYKSIVPQQLYLIRAGMVEQLPAPALSPSSSVVSTKSQSRKALGFFFCRRATASNGSGHSFRFCCPCQPLQQTLMRFFAERRNPCNKKLRLGRRNAIIKLSSSVSRVKPQQVMDCRILMKFGE